MFKREGYKIELYSTGLIRNIKSNSTLALHSGLNRQNVYRVIPTNTHDQQGHTAHDQSNFLSNFLSIFFFTLDPIDVFRHRRGQIGVVCQAQSNAEVTVHIS